MERPLGGWEFGGGLLLADGLCLVNGGPDVHLLNHAFACIGDHPGWEWVGVLAWLVRQELVQETIIKTTPKTIAGSPPAIARFHFPVVALGFGGPRPIGPGEVVDGDAHAIGFGRLGWEGLLGWQGLLGSRRAHPWPSQGAAGQKTEGLSTHHHCIVDQLASLTHKAIAR